MKHNGTPACNLTYFESGGASNWTVSTVLHLVCLLFGCYVITALCVYEKLLERQRRGLPRKRNRAKVAMQAGMVASTALMVVRVALSCAENFRVDQLDDVYCDVTNKIEVVLYTTATTVVYLVLWLRQHALYRMIAPKMLRRKFLRVLSKYTPSVMILSNVCCNFLFLTTKRFVSTRSGCMVCHRRDSRVGLYVSYVLMLSNQLLFHVLLLALLLYPVASNIRKLRRPTFLPDHHRRNQRLIARASACTLASGCYNALTALVVVVLRVHPNFYKLVYDVDFFVTSVCVCVTFSDWRCRLLPCAYGASAARMQSTYRTRLSRRSVNPLNGELFERRRSVNPLNVDFFEGRRSAAKPPSRV